MLNIRNYNGSAEELYEQLATDYLKYNGQLPDRWEEPYYLDQIEQSLDTDNCWIHKQSLMVVNQDALIYSSWKGTGHDDLLFILDILDKYDDLRIVPLGKHFQDMEFLMNKRGIQMYHSSGSAQIRLDINIYHVNDIREYLNWDQS